MKTIVRLVLVLIPSILFLSSCMKDSRDEDTSIAVDNAIIEAIFTDEQNIADQAPEGQLSTFIPETGSGILSQCAVITIDLQATPKTIVVDFGLTNCLCADNRFRKGKIILSFTGAYRDSNTVVTHTFDGYFVNDYQVTGIKTVTNNGHNAQGNLSFTMDVDAKVYTPKGDSIIWKSKRTNEWVEGEHTPIWWDDVYLISGSANGISSSGLKYDLDITTPLRKEIGYKHIVSGILEIKPQGKLLRIIDYGDGSRDNEATVTINGVTFNILLG